MPRLSNEKKLSRFLDEFNYYANERQGLDERNLEILRHYKRIDESLKKRAEAGLSAIYVPKMYTTLEVKKAKIVAALFAGRPYAMATPRPKDPPNSQEQYIRALNMTALLDYQTTQLMNFYRIGMQFVGSWLMYGGAGLSLGWRRKSHIRKVRRIDPRTGTLTDPMDVEEVLYDGPEIYPHDPFTIYFDPYARGNPIDDSESVFILQHLTKEELKRLEDEGYIKGVGKIEDTPNVQEEPWMAEKRELEGFSSTQGMGNRHSKRHEVLTRWTDDHVQIIVDRQWIVKDEENPHFFRRKPIVFSSNNALVGEAIGEGDAYPILPLQQEINAIRNRRMDNQNVLVYKMFKIRRGEPIDENELIPRPFGLVTLDDLDALQEFDFKDVTQSAFEEDRIIDDEIQTTSRVFKHMYGAPFTKRATATEIATLGANADEGFQIQVRLLATEFLQPTFKIMMDLNQQYLSPGTAVQVLGLRGGLSFFNRSLSPEDIVGDFDIKITGTTVDTLADRQFKVNQMINLLAQVGNSGAVNIPKFVEKILLLSDVEGAQDLILPQQPQPSLPTGQQVPQDSMADLSQVGMTRMGPTPAETPLPS